MFILLAIIVLFVICFLIPCQFGLFNHSPDIPSIEVKTTEPETIDDSIDDSVNNEKRVNLENTITKYNRMLDILEVEYLTETDNKKRVAILTKQAATLEKLNRTIDKLEKLE